MTDTPSDNHLSALHYAADTFRRELTNRGFSDDGELLIGSVNWQSDGRSQDAKVAIKITPAFPFAPPKVTVVDSPVEPTFHIEIADDALCLWTSSVSVDEAPWRDVDKFLSRVSGWFKKAEEGWPGDNDADLERYLVSIDGHIVIYDIDSLIDGKFYRTSSCHEEVIRVKDELGWSPKTSRKKDRGVRRRERDLCYVFDAGEINRPIKDLEDLAALLGGRWQRLSSLVEMGSMRYLLIKYKRGERSAVLVVGFTRNNTLVAYESADSSPTTRTLRSNNRLSSYSKNSVLIIGCGAIGSHLAELLYKSGVRRITIVDPERLRPGNLIRHLCHDKYVGLHKVVALKKHLSATGLDVSDINISAERIGDPSRLLEIASGYDLLIDTTADTRATALLHWASEKLETRMISVCLQRDGGIARVDRFPVEEDEDQLDPVPDIEGALPAYEKGCGSAISTTSPLAVVKAAALGAQIALDELSLFQKHPATIIEVIDPQQDKPFENFAIITPESRAV